MNILINNYCNLKCSYCFAQDVMAENTKSMTQDDFKFILDFLEKSEEDLRIIGGEPTLHPQFCDFLLEAIARPKIKHINIFTNGTFSKKVLSAIAAYSTEKSISMLINCNSPEDVEEEKFKIMMENIAYLSKKPIKITLGLNVYNPNQDYSYIIDLAKIGNVKNIRWTVVIPKEKKNAQNDIINYFTQFIPFASRFIEDCVVEGLSPHVDCNHIPVCMLDDRTLRLIALIAHDNLKPSICDPVIDVKPDLSVIRCFAMDKLQVNLRDFKNTAELIDYFKENIDNNFKNKPLFDACAGCASFSINKKSCTCLSFRKVD